MSNTALITGASSGIGVEFARLHAAAGGDLVLVARSGDKLEALAAELRSAHGVRATVLVEDLAQAGSAERVFAATEAAGVEVDVLINNAGFGGHGLFHQRERTADEAMVQLNVATLTSLTHRYVQGMVARGRGRVLNVSSTASFLPGPLQATYFATKAFVTSFSQAIAEELRGTGVSVTALCPGPVDTGFVAAGDLEGVSAFDNAASPAHTAKAGYDGMLRGDLIAYDSRPLKFLTNWVVPLLPRRWVLKLSRQSMQKAA